MLSLLPLLIGLGASPQPIYAALIDAPTALLTQEDELLVAAGGEIVLFRLDRGVMVRRHRVQVGAVQRMSGWDPVQIETADGRWRWSPGAEPEHLPVSAAGPTREVVINKTTWTLDAKGALVRNGVPIAAVGATELLSLGHHGILTARTGAAATGEGDLTHYDYDGKLRWRSGRAPIPTAVAYDPKRSAVWVGNPSGAIDRWRIDDGSRVPAIPSGRSEPIKCVAARGDQVLVADDHGGVWLWKARRLVSGKRFEGRVASVTLDPIPTALIRAQGKVIRWQFKGGAPVESRGGDAVDCERSPSVEADRSLLRDGVRYVVRADGHWRSESSAGVLRGRVIPRRGR